MFLFLVGSGLLSPLKYVFPFNLIYPESGLSSPAILFKIDVLRIQRVQIKQEFHLLPSIQFPIKSE